MTKVLKYNVDPRFKRSINRNLVTLPMDRRQEQLSDVDAGSTLQRKHAMPVIVNRYFTDANGTVISKANAGLVAAGMATDYPLFVLGEFDRQGGYKTGQSILSPINVPGTTSPVFLTSFVNGSPFTSNNIVTAFSPFNTIQPILKPGDIVTVWVDNLSVPTY